MSEPRDNEGIERKDETPKTVKADGGSPKAKQNLVVIALIAVTVACVVFIIGYLMNLNRVRTPDMGRLGPPQEQGSFYENLDGQEMGAGNAKVDILVVLPLNSDCQGTTLEYIRRLGETYPNNLHIRFVNYFSDEGQRLASCASVFIDGKEAHQDSEGRHIDMTGPLGENYTIEDVRVILQAKLDAAYGEGAPKLASTGISRAFEKNIP